MKLVLVRHGQSVWNLENRFTGWTDVELSNNGIKEAKEAGKLLKENEFTFDVAYTSVLKRANETLNIILKELGEENIPIHYSWKLNERHYGALQGLNKDDTRKKYGDEQVKIWRRSAFVRPPLLNEEDDRYPGMDDKYKDLKKSELPLGECLMDTLKRGIDYYETEIKKSLLSGQNVIIAAHGNSLRALIKYLEDISDDDIMNVEIPTGKPYVYELDDNLNIINKYYL
jgi:2,3-bisphosphoglycerate-dependent phosphoglycerate mutase